VNTGPDFTLPHSYIKAILIISLLTVWVVVGLFQYLNRYTQRKYFSTWTAAWLFYAVFLTLNIALQDIPANPYLIMLKNWTVGASAVFLLWGSLRFLKFQTPQRLLLGLLLFLVIWSYYAARQDTGALTSLWIQAPTFLLLGMASGVTAYAYIVVRRKRNFIGAGLLAVGFTLWGLYLTGYPFFQLSKSLSTIAFFPSAVLQLFIAVSMIVLVLEEVRATAEFNRQRLLSAKSNQKLLRSKVRSTEDRYRKLFEQANEAIIITSADDLKILEMNDSARVLLGASNLHQRELSLSRFCLVGQGGQNSAREWFDWLTRQRQVQVIRASGSTVQVEVSGSLIWFAGQKAYQFFFRELTERARLEQQLRQADKLSAIGQMISGVSHELNNPLTSIKGYLELILAHHALPPETRRDLQRVAEESDRAARLVQSFLAFSREHTHEFRMVDLRRLIESVAELRRFDLRLNGAELVLDFAEALPPVHANEDQLKQILVNLVNNSIQAMAGQPEKRLKISVRFSDVLVQIKVQDNGPGIPAEVLPRIFEPFFTTKPVGAGTGLGLSLAHNILIEHKGRIFHEPVSERGACFVIELPSAREKNNASGENMAETAAETPPQPTAAPAPAAPRAQFAHEASGPARILILDDETSISELLGEMLGLLGYQPVKCNSPREALELVQKQSFDLVLSDFRMPGMNGRQFYEAAIQKQPGLAKKVIFLTGDVVTEETQNFLRSTGNPHLAKPFQLSSVQEIITEALEQQALAA
jgi:PAS domain S-box-containing protein